MKKLILSLFIGVSAFANDDALNYLNSLRAKAGLSKLTENSYLDKAALNHSTYLKDNNIFSHYESNYNQGFTGETPSKRVVYAGYLSKKVSENISYGDKNYTDSIDNLFSAIYHRFGFLDESIDEIGLAKDGKYFTYDMGDSHLNSLCQYDEKISSGVYYYTDICSDTTIKISATNYNSAINNITSTNPKIVLWPPKDYNNSDVVFYEEMPDPLPNMGVSGYPVSIEFNKYKIKTPPTMISFTLFNEKNEKLKSKVLTSENDPNNEFNKYEFALFPLNRLDYNQEYKAVFKYQDENNQDQTISWNFHTKKLNYPLIEYNQTINVLNNKTYAFYVKPKNGENILLTGCSYNIKDLNLTNFDKNIHLITLNGDIGKYAKCNLNNGESVKFIVSNKDNVKKNNSPQESVNKDISNNENVDENLTTSNTTTLNNDLSKVLTDLPNGWSLVGFEKEIDPTQIDINYKVMWIFENGQWMGYSKNKDILAKIKDKFELIKTIKPHQGFWIYKD